MDLITTITRDTTTEASTSSKAMRDCSYRVSAGSLGSVGLWLSFLAAVVLLLMAACSDSTDSDSSEFEQTQDQGSNADAVAPGGDTDSSLTGNANNPEAEIPVALGSDRDRDGVVDLDDAFPDDPDESLDTDSDLVGDNADTDPDDPFSCRDSDDDSCDDCVNGRADPEHDGRDSDFDGLCDACHARCSGNGLCAMGADGVFCDCDPGWGGDDCTADADACALADSTDKNPCNTNDANGICTDDAYPATTYTCTCSAGYVSDGTTCVEQKGFFGDEVTAMMPTQAAGPLFDSGTTAIVGSGVEFSTRNITGKGGVDLDIGADSFTFSLINTYENGFFNMGILGLEISDLNSITDPGAQIVNVVVTSSTFPANTFDVINWGPDSITIDLSEPNLLIPAQTTWTATFSIETR